VGSDVPFTVMQFDACPPYDPDDVLTSYPAPLAATAACTPRNMLVMTAGLNRFVMPVNALVRLDGRDVHIALLLALCIRSPMFRRGRNFHSK